MSINVRGLKAGDIMHVSGIVAQTMAHIDFSLFKKEEGDEEKQDGSAVGFHVMQVLLQHSREETWAWLASMANMTVEEFNEQELSAVTEVIDAITKDPGAKDFFSRLRSLISGSALKSYKPDSGGQTK